MIDLAAPYQETIDRCGDCGAFALHEDRCPGAEVLRTPADRRVAGLPREKMARTRGVLHPRRPALWASADPFDGPAPVFGAYPKGFVLAAARWLGAAPAEVLHVCSGMLGPEHGGVRVDVRQAARPTVRADGRALPFRDGAARAVMIDPPYSVEYAADLYGTAYPRPSHLLAEAARVVRPGGRVGMLHFLVPFPVAGLELVAIKGVTTGCGYRIRAFTVFERPQDDLPGVR